MFNKSRKETQSDQSTNSIGFNPSKTFGGVRSKGPMFPLPAEFEETEKKEEEPAEKKEGEEMEIKEEEKVQS